jgi:hypothetical protein
MKPATPLEACIQIASEQAANTIAAIEEERAARLATRLEDYRSALSELADNDGDQPVE